MLDSSKLPETPAPEHSIAPGSTGACTLVRIPTHRHMGVTFKDKVILFIHIFKEEKEGGQGSRRGEERMKKSNNTGRR